MMNQQRVYSREYAETGVERLETYPANLNKAKGTAKGDDKESEYNAYWNIRKDEHWVAVPGFRRYIRKIKESKFITTLPQILINLQPATTFNPYEVWEKLLVKEEDERRAADDNTTVETLASGNAKGKSKEKTVKTGDQIKAKNIEKKSMNELVREVTKIRNVQKNELITAIREIKIFKARAILFVEILNTAYSNFTKGKKSVADKRLLYESFWAIEEIMPLPDFNAPQPLNPAKDILHKVKNPSLVYDDFKKVEELMKNARKLVAKETDLVRLQLVEMSDSLPPLSKFSVGFKLDDWQKRVLRWIDAGKSVIICAPTSSGKTVLSSYVALIFKTEQQRQNRPMIEAEELAANEEALEERDDEDVDSDSSDDEEEQWEAADFNLNAEEEAGEEEDAEGEESSDEEEDAAKRIAGLIHKDYNNRQTFLSKRKKLTVRDNMRVLFVVPTEPLVWQVAAYFTKLLMEVGERETKVALVTDQLIFCPTKKFGVVPQIVVGTPLALESTLSKPRGIVGVQESNKKVQGNMLPGGFDHYDWVIYDEVHSLDGAEGDALQRLIRCMNCKFLALSATVGNAEQLRGWMERVRGDQLYGVESINPEDTLPVRDMKVTDPVVAGGELKEENAVVAKLVVVQTLSEQSFTLHLTAADMDLTRGMTVLNLKEKTYERWEDTDPECVKHARYPMQFKCGELDLGNDSATLASYDIFQTEGGVLTATIHMNKFVNLLVHQSRFINLQRHLWDCKNNTLSEVSPVAAIRTVQSLKDGILGNSSLSFTSKDSFRLWDEISRLFPASAVEFISPYNFFGAQERITLQRTKDYEDLLKKGLKILANTYPYETLELISNNQVLDQECKEIDLCAIVLDLKEKEMTPCLPFHLSTFEAVRLFNQILAGMEYRQKVAEPHYYMQQQVEKDKRRNANTAAIAAMGGKDKDVEEAKRDGDIDDVQDFTVDEYAPSPNFILTNGMPLTENELINVCDEMERYDGFEKRSPEDMKKNKGKSSSIMKHALVRGLRRGIGLFINEVSFPAYRRAVQRLASKGKLAVVVSDDSLAFGVNMPFRSCIFCGEMYDQLDELMAQQMSGRAGRRGLDTQGNLVYAGLRASTLRRLMMGKITDITGREHNPRYATMFLNVVLSARHVGWSRTSVLGGRTLLEQCEHVEGGPANVDSDYVMTFSRELMEELGFVTYDEDKKEYVPEPQLDMNYGLLAAVFLLRDNVPRSISIGLALPQIIKDFSPLVEYFSYNEKKTNTEKLEPFIFMFLVVMAVFVNRQEYDSSDPEAIKLSECQYFNLPAHRTFLEMWLEKFRSIQETIPDAQAYLRDPVPHTAELDGRLFQTMYDRNYIHTLSFKQQQIMKTKVWQMGNVFKTLANCFWPEEDDEDRDLLYHRVSFFIFRPSFLKLRYLNSELIRQVIDFDDISSFDREKRTEVKAVTMPAEAMPWFDNKYHETDIIKPNPWAVSIERVAARLKEYRAGLKESDKEVTKMVLAEAGRLTKVWKNLQDTAGKCSDTVLLEALSGANMSSITPALIKSVAQGIARASTSFPEKEFSAAHMIGTLVWFCLRYSVACKSRFPVFLKTLFEEDLLTEEAISQWYNRDSAEFLAAGCVPEVNDSQVTAEELVAVKTSCKPLMEWLAQSEDEDDDEEDDDEDED